MKIYFVKLMSRLLHSTIHQVMWYFWVFIVARSKIQKPRKSQKSRKFFSKNFESEFSILAVEQNRKLGIIFPRFPTFLSFQFAIFSIFKKIFFNILKHRNNRSYMFLKIRVLKNFAIFIGRHLCWSLFFKRLASYLKKKTPKQVLPANIARTAFL